MKVINFLRFGLLVAILISVPWLGFPWRGPSSAKVFCRAPVSSSTGLRLTASVDKSLASQGEPIRLQASVKNGTRKKVYVTESNPLADYKIEVADDRGRLVPPTVEGKKLLMFSMWTRRLSIEIDPGQEIHQTFEVNRIYSMPPGTYTIVVRRRVTTEWQKKTIELTSNIAKVRVLG